MSTATANTTLQRHRDALLRLQPQAPGGDQPWLARQRREAADSLARIEPPQRRQEAWRYTSVDRLLEQDFSATAAGAPEAASIDVGAFALPGLDAWRAVFVNGLFAPALSSLAGLPPGVSAGSLRAAIQGNPIVPARWLGKAAGSPAHAFNALNTAALNDGLLLHLPRGVQLPRPLEVLHLTTAPGAALAAHPRALLLLETGARATLIERYASLDASLYFNNGLSEIFLEEGARLEHLRLQDESPSAFHLHSLFVSQDAHSRYRNTGFALGGAWSRTELNIRFTGTGAEAGLDGLYLTGERQLSDVHIDIRHAVPGCTSHTDYKGLLHGKGRAVFDGRIVVSPDAQKSDARLHNANLLLSRSAEVDTKPQLEIYADDVKCSHGTTVGQLDPAQLFYLRSRGIDPLEARRMLCLGFAGEILQRCSVEPLREAVEAGIAARLTAAPADGGAGA